MIGLSAVFWIFVFLFAIVGAMRGWAKELLVTFSVILAAFIIAVLENIAPVIKDILAREPATRYWVRTLVLIGLAFFGYQSPNISRLASNNRFARERLQDYLLGIVLGGINAYLIFGSLWFYMNDYHIAMNAYPFAFIIPPDAATDSGKAALDLIARLPPVWLNGTLVYIAVAVAFAFVLVVFL